MYIYPNIRQPNVCPGCGRCNTCGRGDISPYPRVYPYWGTQIYTSNGTVKNPTVDTSRGRTYSTT